MSVLPFKRPEKPQVQAPKHPPMLNVPPLTLAAIVVMVAVQIALAFGPQAIVQAWGYHLAFVPARYTTPGAFDLWAAVSPLTYTFLHGGWLHIAMNGLMFMAFGAACERMMGAGRTASLFVLCGLGGALAHFLWSMHSPVPMIGASGALSGLFAVVIMRLQNSGSMPAGKWGIWGIAAIWIGLSFVMSMAGGAIAGSDLGDVAWAAHAGGFLAGIALGKTRYYS